MQFGTTGGGLGPRLQRRFATPFGAAWASFFLPGLGQAAAGDPRRGAIIAIPAIAIIGVLVGLALFARHAILDNATNQQWLTSLMILNVVALIYHVWAMADAYMVAKRELPKEQRKSRARGGRSTGRPALKLTSMLAVLVLAAGPLLVHGALAVGDASLQDAAACLNSLVPCWMLKDAGAIESQVPLSGNDDQNVSVAGESPSPDSSTSSSASGTPVPGASLAVPDAPPMEPTQNSSNWAADGKTLLYLNVPADPMQITTIREHAPDTNADALVAKTSQYAHFGFNQPATAFVGACRSAASPTILIMLRCTRRELTLCEHKASNPAMTAPRFSLDTQRLYFQSDRDGKPAIYGVHLEKFLEKTEAETAG